MLFFKKRFKLFIQNPESIYSIVQRINLFYLLVYTIIIIMAILLSYFLTHLTLNSNNINKLIQKVDNSNELSYKEIPVKKYIGRNGYIEILDENLNILYSGIDNSSVKYNKNMFNFISDADKNTSYYINELINENNDINYLITEYKYDEGGNREYLFLQDSLSATAVFDKNYKLIYSNIPDLEIESLTEEDINAIFDNNDTFFSIKHSFTYNGKNRYLILHLDSVTNPGATFISTMIIFSLSLSIVMSLLLNFFLSDKTVEKITYNLGFVPEALNKILDGHVFEKDKLLKIDEFTEIADTLDETGIRFRDRRKYYEKQISEKSYQTAGFIHDIKNSINLIINFADELGKGNISSEESEMYLKILTTEANDAFELSYSLTELNKLNSPDFKLHKETTDLVAFLEDFLSSSESEFKLKGFLSQKNIPSASINSSIDKSQLLRVFKNFKYNFLKYCEAGNTFFFNLKLKEDKALIEIGNDGIPIDASIRDKIFSAYIAGDNNSENYKGNGIGLALAAKIISLHSGTIKLSNDCNNKINNLFQIEIPIIK